VTWPPAPPAPPPPPSLPPPGWYPDPSGQPTQRWWDGTRWTQHVGTPPPVSARPQFVTTSGTASGTAPLAGWWLRFGGYVLDAVIVDVPVFVVSLAITLSQPAGSIPGTTGRHLGTAAQVGIVAFSVLISLGYPYLLLRYKGQTVGMMAVGVRAVDGTSGAFPTSAQAARRVLVFFVLVSLWLQISVLIAFRHVFGPEPAAVVLLRLLSFAAVLTTGLWPLGSPTNQTLQDKAAGTVVVRTRS